MTFRTTRLFTSLTAIAGLMLGCADDSDSVSGPEGSVFESDAPGSSSRSTGEASLASDDAGASAGGATGAANDSNSEATRAIEEADIIKIEGTRLYALSQYGGLNIIDVSERDNMKLLGRKKVQASPFEMYVRDSIVFALYNGYGEYVEGAEAGYWNWIQTSYVIAFDTTVPESPTIIGRFPISGSISDSRIVGDVLYVVGYQSDYCWECTDGEQTTVLSLNVASPANIEKVDQLNFTEDSTQSYSWTRSIFVNDQRMYVAGPEWGTYGPVGSEIQVVDISDASGDLVAGTTVRVAGTVNSRWQMDEYDGYLRVISQPNAWDVATPVSVQTFKVDSAQSVTPVANVPLSGVPAGETLRSVRFDGARGYAITAEQTDPLFTVDLSDPTAPTQAGSLEMPGWIYHMEPRGERLVALGLDSGNAAGALTVSLFDVSELTDPTMIERVNFGGDWASFTEGQDQIQKAFQVLDDANLILMPFSGWDYTEDACWGKSTNGVQLIDWYGDDLRLQGVASLVGQPRRGFLYDDRLFTVSEERVETYDIADRSAPKRTDSLKTAENVTSTVVAGNTVVKVTNDWYSNSVGLDTTTLADVENPETLGHLDLAIGTSNCGNSYLGTVTAAGDRVYLVVNGTEYDYTTYETTYTARIVTVDVSEPSDPKVIAQANVDFGEGWGYWYGNGLVSAGESSVAVGNAFVVLSSEWVYDSQGYATVKSVAHVLDMAEPAAPKVSSFEVPGQYGTTGLFVSGSTVAYGYYEPSSTNSERVRFYASRIDVSDPANPERLAPVNVPGSLVAFDADSSNAVTADYQMITIEHTTSDYCYNTAGSWNFSYDENSSTIGTCYTMQESINLVNIGDRFATLLGSKSLEIGEAVNQLTQGNDRLFFTTSTGYGYGYATLDVAGTSYWGGYYYSFNETELPLFVVSGLSSGEFAMGSVTLAGGNGWYSSGPMAAWNQRVLLSTGWQGELVVVDGAEPTAPAVVRTVDIPGGVSDLSVTDGVGIASMGYDGVATVEFE